MIRLILIKCLFIIYIPNTVNAQDLNPWAGLNIQKKIDQQFTFLWENQYRFFEGEYSELQWRVGLIYKKNQNWSFAGGGFASFNKEYSLQEVRPWQQVIYAYPLDKFNLFIRYRQEQRFFTITDEFANRSRLQFRVNYNLSKIFTPYISTEFFVGLNQATKANFPEGYNQNRTQIGTLIKVTPNTNIETSYMQVYNKTISKDTVNNVLWTSIQFRF
jgi:hypothetical protein